MEIYKNPINIIQSDNLMQMTSQNLILNLYFQILIQEKLIFIINVLKIRIRV